MRARVEDELPRRRIEVRKEIGERVVAEMDVTVDEHSEDLTTRGRIVSYSDHCMSGTSPGIPRTRALQRAVSVLHAVAGEPGASASSLGRTAGLPRATVTRTLRTLADAGLVEEVDGGWMLGYEVVRLARGADPFRAVIRAAGRPLDQLRDATGESALLAVPVGRTEMEIVLQLDASHIVGVTDWVGTHPPLHASAAGKLLLAELVGARARCLASGSNAAGRNRPRDPRRGVAFEMSCAAYGIEAGRRSLTSSRSGSPPSLRPCATMTERSWECSGSAGRRFD